MKKDVEEGWFERHKVLGTISIIILTLILTIIILSKLDTKQKPVESKPITIVSNSFDDFKVLCDTSATNLQKREIFDNKFKNNYVEWMGIVSSISESSGSHTILVKHCPSTFVSDIRITMKDDQKDKLLNYAKGDSITYRAKLINLGDILGLSASEGIILSNKVNTLELDKSSKECDKNPKCYIDISSQYEKVATLRENEDILVWVKYRYKEKWPFDISNEGGGSGSGVILTKDNKKLLILTSRHVVDCNYIYGKCDKKSIEEINVRTKDGVLHNVSMVLFEPNNLDIALLVINTKNSYKYQISALKRESPDFFDPIIAIGFPTANLEGGYTEFESSFGKITKIKEILSPEGIAFEAYETDTSLGSGSSGGGLFFQKNGQLIGINSWGDNYESVAIGLPQILNISSYHYCKIGSYLMGEDCVGYEK